MPDVDLDAAHKAREETQNGSGPGFKLGGKRWPLKTSPPVILAESYGALFVKGAGIADVRTFLRHALARPADVDKVLEAGFVFDDAVAVLDAWRIAEGESSASGRSSSNGGKPSRPTSKRSTKSTSRARSTAKKR